MGKGLFWFKIKKVRKISPDDIVMAFRKAEEIMRTKESKLNSINVFPVPDGDTGSNMYLTIKGINRGIEESGISSLKLVAVESARGNSGMFLSQFLIGFSEVIKDKMNINDLAEGFRLGYERAYRITDSPKEGTILTIMRKAAEYLESFSNKTTNITKAFSGVVARLKKDVRETRDQLSILKKSNVVDAGALGFVYFLDGWHASLGGSFSKDLDRFITEPVLIKEGPIKFRYCTQVLVETYEETAAIWKRLKKYGTDLRIVREGETVKVHIHTNTPNQVTQCLEEFSSIINMRAEDMLVSSIRLRADGDSE